MPMTDDFIPDAPDRDGASDAERCGVPTVRERHAREGRFRYAIEASNVGLWDFDIATGAVYFSPAFAALLDDPCRDRAWRWSDLAHPDDQDVLRVVADSLRNSGHCENFGHCEQEFRLRFNSGYRWVLSRGKAVAWDAAGRPQRAIGTLIDIDERKQAEAHNRRLAAIIEASSDLIAIATPAGAVNYLNPAGRALLGIGAQASLNQESLADYHPSWAAQRVMEEGFPTALACGRWLGDSAMLRRDGSTVPVSQLILAQPDPATGEIEFLSTICRDLSARLRADALVRQLQQDQELILDSMPALIWYKDTANRILRVNALVAQSLGLPKAQIEGRHAAELYPDEAENEYRDDCIAMRTGTPLSRIEARERPDSGALRWIRTDKIPLIAASGQATGILAMATDITERRMAEEALRESARRKDEFIAILAHELRNPLAPLKNAVQILRHPGLDEATRNWSCAAIERQVDHLTRLLDDLLDISRVSRGKLTLQRTSLAVADIVAQAVEFSRPLIAARQHELVLCMAPESLRVAGDLVRLSQVLSNLLNNAATYTAPGGRIRLAVAREDDTVVMRIADTGIGIAPSMIEQIFDLFFQADRSHQQFQGGLGIGLNLARQIVTLHGGTILARSAGLGTGSEFIVRLPCAANRLEEVAPRPPDAPESLPRRRVLVADDHADVLESLALLLNLMGHEVRTAQNGREAVAIAATFRPELILMDLGMPEMNGYDACRQLRAAADGAETLIVALSGWGQDRHRKATREAGFDRHLVKPIGNDALRSLLEDLTRDGAAPGDPSGHDI